MLSGVRWMGKYRSCGRYVYEGICDGEETKYIVQHGDNEEWDKKITLKFSPSEGLLYFDSKGKQILVFTNDEDGYYQF